MIGTFEIRCHAAKPQMPLSPMFAFKDSPSSLRLLEIPKKIGEWNITTVKVAVNYPDNTTNIYTASRNGNVWVVTFNGCSITGKVANGLEVLADGIDENGDAVNGYVLGVGDIYILERDADIEEAVSKHTMRYCDETPETPVAGDVVVENGTLKIYDGTQWISIDIDLSEYATKSELETSVTTLDDKIDSTKTELESSIAEVASDIPTTTSELTNDSGFITSAALPTKTSDLTNDSDFTTTNEVNQMISVKRDLTNLNYVRAVDYNHPERIVGFQVGITYYTMFEKVSDTLYKWHNSTWNGQSGNDHRIELSLENPAEPIFSYYRGNDELITSFTIPNSTTSFSWEYQDYSGTHVLELLSEDTIALKNDRVSQFINDCGYLTKVDVVPAEGQYTGYADKAKTAGGVGATYPTNDPVVVPALAEFSSVNALWDNTTGTILRAYTYENYPWKLSMLSGTTFDPAIELKWGYWYITRKQGRKIVTVWRGLGWRSDYVNGVAYLIGNPNNDGTTVGSALITLNGDQITSTFTSKDITLSENGKSIETYDGQTGVITCTRDYTTKGLKSTRFVAFQDELPTKTSDLTNDSGFLTTVSWNDVQGKPTNVSDFTNDAGYVNQQTLNTALSGKVSKSGDTVQWIGIGRIEQKIQANDQLGFEFSIDEFGSAKVVPPRGVDVTLNFPSTNGTLATTDYVTSQIPTKTSDLVNDSGFITASAIPSQISAFENNVGYITASAIPSNISSFNNDAGYLTAGSQTIQDITASVSSIGSNVTTIDASVISLGTSVTSLGTSVSALAVSMSGKRNYPDLTYVIPSHPSEDNYPELKKWDKAAISKFVLTITGYGAESWDLNYFTTSPTEGLKWIGTPWTIYTSDGWYFYLKDSDEHQGGAFRLEQFLSGDVTFSIGIGGQAYSAKLHMEQNEYCNITLDYQTSTGKLHVKRNGVDVGTYDPTVIEGTNINIVVPTNISQLDNDSGFVTATTVASNYYNKTQIDGMIGSINTVLDNINGEVI